MSSQAVPAPGYPSDLRTSAARAEVPSFRVAATSVRTAAPSGPPCDRSPGPDRPAPPDSSTTVCPAMLAFDDLAPASGRSASARDDFDDVATARRPRPVAAASARAPVAGGGRRRRRVGRASSVRTVSTAARPFDPVRHALAIELDRRRLRARVVVPEHLDEAASRAVFGFGHDHAEERALLRTRPTHTNDQHLLPSFLHCSSNSRCATRSSVSRFIRAAGRRDRLRRRPCRRCPPTAFSIFRICTNCLSSRFTSSTLVPLPARDALPAAAVDDLLRCGARRGSSS